MTALHRTVLALIPLLALPVACGGGSTPAPSKKSTVSAADPAADRLEAKKTFESICFTCHGMKGRGDGPGSAALTPKPRDLADEAWQKSVTDDHIRTVITLGGAAVGKSPMMPPQPQLKSSPRVLDALVAHVRSLAQAQ